VMSKAKTSGKKSASEEDKMPLMKTNEKIEMPKKEFYHKYRWFFTKSGKLVYGGKNAEQNEEIIKDLLKNKKNRIVMHTKIPGSPFSVIEELIGHVTLKDMNEVAVWTACFSRAWRSKLKKTGVDIFLSEQIMKKEGMKTGTFGVFGKIDRINVDLKLALCKQKDVLRAIPEESANGKKFALITPGEVPKEVFAMQLSDKLKLNKEEVLSALPTGSFSLIK